MFGDLLDALAFVWGVNNDMDENLKRDRYVQKPIQPWITQNNDLLKAEMTAKWLVYHKSTFQEVYRQLLLAGNKEDVSLSFSLTRADPILEIFKNCNPIFTDEMLMFGLCMQFNSASEHGETVEDKKKLLDLFETSLGELNYFRSSGIYPKESFRKRHKIAIRVNEDSASAVADEQQPEAFPAYIKGFYGWYPEYFDGCYFWNLAYCEQSDTFYPYRDSNDQMAHDGYDEEDDDEEDDD
jgi:hypothetical protein